MDLVSGRNQAPQLSPGRVVVAHRFAFAVMHGVQAAAEVHVLGHRCDNPLCQRVGPGHVVASSYVARSITVAASKTVRSASAPTRMRPLFAIAGTRGFPPPWCAAASPPANSAGPSP